MEPWVRALQSQLEQAPKASGLRLPPGFQEGALREAAVLLPLLFTHGAAHVLFTRRQETLRSHAGQISFPGGTRDTADASALATALRETEEELGVPTAAVRVLGALDEIPTLTGYRIHPFVGVLAEGSALTPHPEEVAEVLVVPWAHLRAPENLRTERKVFWGMELDTYSFQWQHHVIWGATAHILQNLLRLTENLPAFLPPTHP